MKKIFTLIAVAAVAFAAQAAEWTAADGTATGEYAPVYGYNFETDQHNQMQYPAAELTGMAAGSEITVMKFYTSTPDAVNDLGGFVTVSLANINEVTPWSVNLWDEVDGDLLDVDMTTVAATVSPAADENGVWTITLDAPFTYAGGALLIDVQSVAGDWKNTYFYGKEMGEYYALANFGYSGTTKKAQTILPKVTFTYEAGQGGGTAVDLLSEANTLEDNTEFTFNGNAVVTLQHGDYLFVRDESGFGQIHGTIDGTFVGGEVLTPGWNATKISDNGWVSYIDPAGISASGETNAALAEAIVLTGAVNESMLNAYVCVENQQPSGGFIPTPARSYTLPDGTSIAKSEILWGVDADASRVPYNVYGIIVKGADGTLMLNPVAFAEYVEPTFLRGDVNDDGIVNIKDVTDLINYLLNGDESAINLDAADCNLSETVNISDVTALINYLLNGSWN